MSDILIRNMEMPTNCGECRLSYYDDDGCDMFCAPLNNLVKQNGKLEDCPLVEVPPHGELIDRDALLNEMDSRVMDEDRINGVYDFAFRCVSDAPPILEASV